MNNELKNKIVSSYETSTPDILDNIKEKIQATDMLDEEVVVTPISRYKKISSSLAVVCSLAAAVLIFVFVVKTGSGSLRFNAKSAPANDSCAEEPAAAMTEEAVYEDYAPKLQMSNEVLMDAGTEDAGYADEAENADERMLRESEMAGIYIDIDSKLSLSLDEEFYVVGISKDEMLDAIIDESDIVGLSVEVAFKNIVTSLYMNGYFKEDAETLHLRIDTENKASFENLESTFYNIMGELPINNSVTVEVVYSR